MSHAILLLGLAHILFTCLGLCLMTQMCLYVLYFMIIAKEANIYGILAFVILGYLLMRGTLLSFQATRMGNFQPSLMFK